MVGAALAGVAVGLFAGYLLGEGRHRPVVRAPAPSTPAPPLASSPAVPASLAEVLAALPEPVLERGDLAIRGSVRTPEGWPVSGVLVHAKFISPPEEYESEAKTLEEAVICFVAKRRWGERIAAQATSGADGTFVLDGLRDVEYVLEASAAGHVLETDEAWVFPPAVVEYVARAAGQLHLDVVLPDGTRPPKADVLSRDVFAFWRPEASILKVPAGVHDLEVHVPDLPPDRIRVEVPVRGVVRATARPGSGPAIHGRVEFVGADPVGGVTIRTLRFKGEPPPARVLIEDGDDTDLDDDTYSLAVEPGRYLVGVVAGDIVFASRVAEVVDAPVARDFLELTLDRRRFATLRIAWPDGEPCSPDFEAGILDEDGDTQSFWMLDDVVFRTHDDCTLVAVPEPGKGRRYVDIDSPYGRKRVFVEGSEPISVRFAESAEVALTAAGLPPDVRLAAAMTPFIEHEDVDDLALSATRFDVDGRCEIDFLESIDHTVVLFVRIDDQAFEAGRQAVSLRAGRNEIAIAPPRLHSLTVRAPAPEPGAIVRMSPRDAWQTIERKLGADRSTTFTHLPAGEWEVCGRDLPETVVRVPEQREVVLAEPVTNALEMVKAGPLARHGLRDGDRIVGIGGKLFKDADQMKALAAAAFAKGGDVTLIVARNDARLEIDVPIAAIVLASDSLRATTR